VLEFIISFNKTKSFKRLINGTVDEVLIDLPAVKKKISRSFLKVPNE